MIQGLETDYQAANVKFQQQFTQRNNEIMAPIQEEVRKVLDDIRGEDGYAMILDHTPGTERDSLGRQEPRHHRSSGRAPAHARGPSAKDRRTSDQARRSDRSGRRDSSAKAAVAVTSRAATGGEEPPTQHSSGENGFVLTAAAIAEVVGGRLVGDPSVGVTGVAPLDRATERDLSFLGAAKYTAAFSGSRAGLVLIAPELAEAPSPCLARIIVDRPQEALLRLLPRFHRVAPAAPGVHFTAVIGSGVRLGAGVSIGPYAVIGDRRNAG